MWGAHLALRWAKVMIHDRAIIAGANDAGLRLDRLVAAHVGGTPRHSIAQAIAEGRITHNGRRAAKGLRVQAGDRIQIIALAEPSDLRALPNPELPLHILHADDHLVALDKPAGLPVHPLVAGETHTLVSALLAWDSALAAIGDDPRFPALAHRLDTDTSGVMLAGRTPAAYAALRTAFREHRVEKIYLALVRGAPPETGRLEHDLGHDPARPGTMRVFAPAPAPTPASPPPPRSPPPRLMRAITIFRVVTRYATHSLIEVRIPTGVTHQIRAQLAHIGHPIAGDTRYGGPTAAGELGLTRHFLHAASIALPHPADGQPLRVESPLPEPLARVLAELPPPGIENHS